MLNLNFVWIYWICCREYFYLYALVMSRTKFQSESTLHSCLNVKELLARNRREIWCLSDCNWTRTHNHLVRKRTLNHLTKLTKWLSWVVSTYLYGVFDCMFLSCHVCVSQWNKSKPGSNGGNKNAIFMFLFLTSSFFHLLIKPKPDVRVKKL